MTPEPFPPVATLQADAEAYAARAVAPVAADLASTIAESVAAADAWRLAESQYKAEIARLSAVTAPPTQKTYGTRGVQSNITSRAGFDAMQGKLIFGSVNMKIPAGESWVLEGANGLLDGTFLQRGGSFGIIGGEWGAADPAKPTHGFNVENATLRGVTTEGFVDSVNFVGHLITVGCLFGLLAQYAPWTPGLPLQHLESGSHADEVAAGAGAQSWTDYGSILRPGPWRYGSVSCIMLAPGLPGLRLYGTTIDGQVGMNVGPDAAFPDLRLDGTLWARGPVGPWPTPKSAAWNGESIIARATPRAQLAAALAAGNNRVIGTTLAPTIKRG